MGKIILLFDRIVVRTDINKVHSSGINQIVNLVEYVGNKMVRCLCYCIICTAFFNRSVDCARASGWVLSLPEHKVQL